MICPLLWPHRRSTATMTVIMTTAWVCAATTSGTENDDRRIEWKVTWSNGIHTCAEPRRIASTIGWGLPNGSVVVQKELRHELDTVSRKVSRVWIRHYGCLEKNAPECGWSLVSEPSTLFVDKRTKYMVRVYKGKELLEWNEQQKIIEKNRLQKDLERI